MGYAFTPAYRNRPDVAQSGINLSSTLVVEDDPRMRARMVRLLSQLNAAEVVEAGSLEAARALAEHGAFAVALVDIGLPDGSGIEFVREMRDRKPLMALVVISAYGDAETLVDALRAGAIGYLLKEREDEELLQALQAMRRGGAAIDPFLARRLLDHWFAPESGDPGQPASEEGDGSRCSRRLTGREREILMYVSRGFSNREIAEILALSRFTVEDHTKRIYRKLSVNSRTEAVFEAKSQGLLP